MSTKTNFKRIALVAIAALGLGVVSSVPSNAAITSLTVTTVAGTATTVKSDSATAATVDVNFLQTLQSDTVTVTVSLKSDPAGLSTATPLLYVQDSANASSVVASNLTANLTTRGESVTSTGYLRLSTADTTTSRTTALRLGASLKVIMKAASTEVLVAGTYVVTVSATPYPAGIKGTAVTADATIVVSAPTTAAAPGFSTAFLGSASTGNTVDAVTNVLATASTTARAYITVKLMDADSSVTNIAESVTVVTNIGTVGTNSLGGSVGKSIVMVYTAGSDLNIGVYSDGTSGTASITVSTPSVTFPAKTVTFYSATVSKIAASGLTSVIGAGATSNVISGTATDANGNVVASATAVYAYSDNTAVISDSGTACVYSSTYKTHFCSLTGISAGTANITLRNTTAYPATVLSSAIKVTVNTKSVASAKLSFDKASYTAGEKAILSVTAYDADGKVMPAGTYTNLFTTGGITSTYGFGSGSDTLTAVVINTASAATASTAPTTDPVARYTVYMPATGSVTVSATGGTTLPVAGQVAIKATATVADSGAAALAAVTALATTVASLKTLITTLTNLVLKIQKKVKA